MPYWRRQLRRKVCESPLTEFISVISMGGQSFASHKTSSQSLWILSFFVLPVCDTSLWYHGSGNSHKGRGVHLKASKVPGCTMFPFISFTWACGKRSVSSPSYPPMCEMVPWRHLNLPSVPDGRVLHANEGIWFPRVTKLHISKL